MCNDSTRLVAIVKCESRCSNGLAYCSSLGDPIQMISRRPFHCYAFARSTFGHTQLTVIAETVAEWHNVEIRNWPK